MAAPKGNTNGAKAKQWSAAIERALDKRIPGKTRVEALDDLAEKLLRQCEEGDLAALKELGDRLDGKPSQQIDHGNVNDKPFLVGLLPSDLEG